MLNLLNNLKTRWPLLSGLLMMLGMGVLVWVVAHILYVILIYPLIMAYGVSVLTLANYFRGLFKNRYRLTIWACIFGIVAYTAYRSCDYLYARWETTTVAVWEQGIDQTTAIQNFDALVQNNSGSPGVLGYLRLEARFGLPLNTHPLLKIEMSEFATWLYWLLEVAIVVGYSAHLSRKALMRNTAS